jgi:uncharacterized integral membrane protein
VFSSSASEQIPDPGGALQEIDAAGAVLYRAAKLTFMNLKLILKTLFMVAIAALLVIMGMYNSQLVDLSMPNIFPKTQTAPAALMYIGFFGVGFLAGAVIMVGGGKSGGKDKQGR